jgi:chemotaxis protein histidine kinase CheA
MANQQVRLSGHQVVVTRWPSACHTIKAMRAFLESCMKQIKVKAKYVEIPKNGNVIITFRKNKHAKAFQIMFNHKNGMVIKIWENNQKQKQQKQQKQQPTKAKEEEEEDQPSAEQKLEDQLKSKVEQLKKEIEILNFKKAKKDFRQELQDVIDEQQRQQQQLHDYGYRLRQQQLVHSHHLQQQQQQQQYNQWCNLQWSYRSQPEVILQPPVYAKSVVKKPVRADDLELPTEAALKLFAFLSKAGLENLFETFNYNCVDIPAMALLTHSHFLSIGIENRDILTIQELLQQ